jgi:hypothetical protein
MGAFFAAPFVAALLAGGAALAPIVIVSLAVAVGAVCGVVILFNYLFNINSTINNITFFNNSMLLITKVASAVCGWTAGFYAATAIIAALSAADIALTGGALTAITVIGTAVGTFVGLLLMGYVIDLGKSLINGTEIKFNHWDNFCLAASGFATAAVWTTSFTVLPAAITAAFSVSTTVCNIICASVAALASSLFFTFGLAPRKEKVEIEMKPKAEIPDTTTTKLWQIYDGRPRGANLVATSSLVQAPKNPAPRPFFHLSSFNPCIS